MTNYPFIKLSFADDNSVEYIKSQYIITGSLNFDYKLLNGLNPSSNRVNIQIVKDCPIVEKIIQSKKDVSVELSLVDENEKPVKRLFTGYVSNKFKWGINEYGKSVLNLTFEDIGTRLLKKPYTEIAGKILKGKASDIITEICNAANISRADAIIIDKEVCLVAEKGKSLEDLLKSLVQEVLYTYYFDAYGRLALKALSIGTKDDYIVDKTNLICKGSEAIILQKDVKQYGSAEVKWKELQTNIKTLVFKDTNGADNKHPNCYITVPANGTYPDQENGKPANIEVTDLSNGKDVVYVENIDPEVQLIGDISYDIKQYNHNSLSVLFTNNSSIEGHIINLEARGDLTVVKSENTTTAGDLDFEAAEVEAKWIHNVNDAKEYAEYLANYYKYCNHTYKFYASNDMNLGDICRLKEETFSGLDVRVLLTAKKYTLNGTYEYTGVGISIFDIKNGTNEGISKPNIQPNLPGNKVNGLKYFYNVNNSTLVPPTTWLEEIPEFTVDNRYLWSYYTTYFSDGTSVDSEPGIIGVLGLDGKQPVVVTPDFTSYVFPAQGSIVDPADYTKMVCTVIVEQGNEKFTYSEEPLIMKTFYVTATGHGITNIEVNRNIIKATANSIMATSSAYIDVTVKYKDMDDNENTQKFKINLVKANSGLDGQYLAYEYALGESSEVAPQIGWSSKYPDDLGDKYLWYRQQTVLPGNKIDPNNWSTPHLSEGNINKVYKDLNVVANKIAFNVTTDGKVYPNTPNGAGLEIGTTTEGGYILLDAAEVISPGTITSSEINTEELYSNVIEIGDRIVSGGYREIDNQGNINPRKLPGFYADAVGKVKMIDAEIKGTIDSDILTTINGIPSINSGNLKPEYQSFWSNANASPDVTEWYNTGKIPTITGAYVSSDPSYANGKVFLGVGISEEQGLYEMGSSPKEWSKVSSTRVKDIHYFSGMYYGWNIHTFYKSGDARLWSEISSVEMDKEGIESVIMRDNIWIVTSGDYANTRHNYYSTDRGATWQPIDSLNSKGYTYIYAIDDGTNFYAYCYKGSTGYDILKSSDGINWSSFSTIDSNFDRHVSYENGYYFSITTRSNDTWINYSTDNITWNQFKTPGPKAEHMTYSYIHNKWIILTREGYIFYSDTINGSYSAIYNKDLTYRLGFEAPIQTTELFLVVAMDETDAIRCAYSTKWSRSSIYNFFDNIIPKIAEGNPMPTYEPFWDLQTVTGTFTYNGSSNAINKFKATPYEIEIVCGNTKYIYDKSRAILHSFNIRNLIIQGIAAIAYMGNTVPKNENVNLGTSENPFRSVHTTDIYGTSHGNVNSEGTRFSYKVWGAVAN